MRRAAAILVLAMIPLVGCASGGAGSPPQDGTNPAPTSTPDTPNTPEVSGPYLPCELLTQADAEAAMAHPSTPGEEKTEGDATFCFYNATSGPNYQFSFAVLTVYPSRAILDENTSFYDLTEVDGVAEWAALSIPNGEIAVSDGDLYMNLSYGAGRICDDILDSESRKAACLEEMRVGLLSLAGVVLEAAGH